MVQVPTLIAALATRSCDLVPRAHLHPKFSSPQGNINRTHTCALFTTNFKTLQTRDSLQARPQHKQKFSFRIQNDTPVSAGGLYLSYLAASNQRAAHLRSSIKRGVVCAEAAGKHLCAPAKFTVQVGRSRVG